VLAADFTEKRSSWHFLLEMLASIELQLFPSKIATAVFRINKQVLNDT